MPSTSPTFSPSPSLCVVSLSVSAMARKTKQWELKEEDRFGAHEMIHVYKVDPKTVVKPIEPPRLPFEGEIAGLLKIDKGDEGESESEAEEDDNDPFAHDTDGDDVPAHIQAVYHIRDILGMPTFKCDADESEDALRVSHLETPVFLGHGSADPKVSVDLGRRMASILSDGFGMDVTWKAYEEFGHWYKVPDEIDDVVEFLKEKAGFTVAEKVE